MIELGLLLLASFVLSWRVTRMVFKGIKNVLRQ